MDPFALCSEIWLCQVNVRLEVLSKVINDVILEIPSNFVGKSSS